jgi:transcriptional regulator with XRE-family HTH domain
MRGEQKHISFRLKKYRKQIGYSQSEAAKILGVSPSRLSEWEKGERMPSAINLYKLSILYRVLPDALYLDLRQSLIKEISDKIIKLEKVKNGHFDKPT